MEEGIIQLKSLCLKSDQTIIVAFGLLKYSIKIYLNKIGDNESLETMFYNQIKKIIEELPLKDVLLLC